MPTKSVVQQDSAKEPRFFHSVKKYSSISLQLVVCVCHFLELSVFSTQLLAKLKSF